MKRPIRIDGEVAIVPLTKGYEAVIDVADAEFVGRWNWYAQPTPSGIVYAMRSNKADGKKYAVSMHREIADAPAAMDVDHRDGDGLNNRRANLRICTTQDNIRAMRLGRRNKLGVKGVYQAKNRFGACITVDAKTRFLGSFLTIEEAKAAYDKAASELFGDFAKVG